MPQLQVRFEQHPQLNDELTQQFLEWLSSIDAGKSLLEDALKLGEVTVLLNPLLFKESHSKAIIRNEKNRTIEIDFQLDIESFLSLFAKHKSKPNGTPVTYEDPSEETLSAQGATIMGNFIFEMCNAANPTLQKLKVLNWATPQEYTFGNETCEFFSTKRSNYFAGNAVFNGKICRIKDPNYEKEDFSIEQHLHIMLSRVSPNYGANKTHANFSMSLYKKKYLLLQDKYKQCFALINALADIIQKMTLSKVYQNDLKSLLKQGFDIIHKSKILTHDYVHLTDYAIDRQIAILKEMLIPLRSLVTVQRSGSLHKDLKRRFNLAYLRNKIRLQEYLLDKISSKIRKTPRRKKYLTKWDIKKRIRNHQKVKSLENWLLKQDKKLFDYEDYPFLETLPENTIVRGKEPYTPAFQNKPIKTSNEGCLARICRRIGL